MTNIKYPTDHICEHPDCNEPTVKGDRSNGMHLKCYHKFRNTLPDRKEYRKKYYKDYNKEYLKKPENQLRVARQKLKHFKKKVKQLETDLGVAFHTNISTK